MASNVLDLAADVIMRRLRRTQPRADVLDDGFAQFAGALPYSLEVGFLERAGRDLSTLNDADLMAAVCRKDRAALQELYDRYFRRAYALALRMLSDPAGAEDCVQDIFLKLWQKPQLYDAKRGAFVSWFLATIHNNASNYLRRRQRTQPFGTMPDGEFGDPEPFDIPDRQDGSSSVEDRLDQAERQKVVRAALAQLNAQQRITLELAYFGGMTQSQIAKHLQEPLGTVKTRMRTGMMKLRVALEDQGWGKDMELG
ncbi:MAG: sigma-70 family RNA polymerase sigma factor [Chloroflexia bacterium]